MSYECAVPRGLIENTRSWERIRQNSLETLPLRGGHGLLCVQENLAHSLKMHLDPGQISSVD